MVTHAKFWRWLVTLLAGIMVVQVVVTSMTSAQVAGAEGDRDLSTLIDDHTILDSVKVSFKDANDQPVPDDQVTNASKMYFDYTWSLPDDLVEPGDWFKFKLPGVCDITKTHTGTLTSTDPQTGEIKDVADAVVTPDGIVTLTFTKNAQMYGVTGTFTVYSDGMQFDYVGDHDILVPEVRDDSAKVPITVIPNQRVDVAKSGGNFDKNTGEISWHIGINNMSLPMNNAVITEVLQDGQTLSGVSIQTASVKADATSGNADGWVGSGNMLREGVDYELQDNQIHLIGDYANTTSPLLVTVKTKIPHPEQAIQWARFHNKVSLTWEGHDYPGTPPDASNTVDISNYVPKKVLKKSLVGRNSTDPYRYQWKVQYNPSGTLLPKGTTLTDTLGAGQRFLENEAGSFSMSKSTYSPNEPEMYPADPLTKDVDYSVQYNGDQMVMTLLKDITSPLVILYDVHIDDPKDGDVLANEITDNHGHTDDPKPKIAIKPHVDKTITNASLTDHFIDYSVDINTNHDPLSDLILTDTMSSSPNVYGATLDRQSLKLVDQTTSQPLQQGTDFTLEPNGNTFVVKFIGTYAKNTDRFTMTYRINLDPEADDQTTWVNHLTGPKIDTNVPWTPETPDDPDPGDSTITEYPPTKEAVWEEADNTLRWNIVVNQKGEVLNGATVTDHIDDNQIYQSVSLYTATTPQWDNKKYIQGTQITDFQYELSADHKQVVVHLPENSDETYMVVVRTTRVDPTTQQAYKDTATYDHGGIQEKVTTPNFWPAHDGNLIDKSGEKLTGFDNKASWKVDVNLSQAHLQNVMVTDVASPNQTIDTDSIGIYPIVFTDDSWNGGTHTVNRDAPLQLDKDYRVTSEVDNETGNTKTTIVFSHDLEAAYQIQYQSTLIGMTGDVTNGVKIEANNVVQDKTAVPVSVHLEGIGGTAEGVPGTFQVHKTSPTGESLPGAEFALTSVTTGLTRTQTTGDDGIAIWKNLISGQYRLKEIKAPNGYQIGPDYQGDGKLVTVKFTGDQPTQTDTVINEKAILPHTGGWQRAIALLIGTMLLALAGWLIVARMKKAGEVG